jgi:hypothetical protein
MCNKTYFCLVPWGVYWTADWWILRYSQWFVREKGHCCKTSRRRIKHRSTHIFKIATHYFVRKDIDTKILEDKESTDQHLSSILLPISLWEQTMQPKNSGRCSISLNVQYESEKFQKIPILPRGFSDYPWNLSLYENTHCHQNSGKQRKHGSTFVFNFATNHYVRKDIGTKILKRNQNGTAQHFVFSILNRCWIIAAYP